jgi:hypothetical protein
MEHRGSEIQSENLKQDLEPVMILNKNESLKTALDLRPSNLLLKTPVERVHTKLCASSNPAEGQACFT